ncbi:MAG: hypothetical protein H6733_17795 [Alphaproteobacteria bacterium]|nr:hypothetical protein [Alphaproteobacteria bacterium]
MHRLALCAFVLSVGCTSTTADKDTDTDTDADTDTVDTDTVDTDTVDTVDTDETDETDDTDVPTDPCLAQPAVISVGSGETAFEALTPGQDLEMFNGPQGGWHHWVSVHADNVPEFVILEFWVTDVASGSVVTISDPMRAQVQLVSDTPGTWNCSGSQAGQTAILDFTLAGATEPTDWSVLCGVEIELGMRVKTPEGVVLGEDTQRVISQPDPRNGVHCTAG